MRSLTVCLFLFIFLDYVLFLFCFLLQPEFRNRPLLGAAHSKGIYFEEPTLAPEDIISFYFLELLRKCLKLLLTTAVDPHSFFCGSGSSCSS